MIECDIYEEGKEDEFPIGGSNFSVFTFNTLPRIGDILWLLVTDLSHGRQEFGMATKEIVCNVVFVAQRSSNTNKHNRGYLIVKIDNKRN